MPSLGSVEIKCRMNLALFRPSIERFESPDSGWSRPRQLLEVSPDRVHLAVPHEGELALLAWTLARERTLILCTVTSKGVEGGPACARLDLLRQSDR
ncbi:hypothetical protein GGTG_09793 [Gaeumannomyces tritici R3-111a-1]|uniref:Uncharacterized protein n=1 Tax=Gaeumannomyces tritici (strain R3-111a-1) TaxID=644352 RepID=J3P8F9_GAET3|nr:hypothetical protein GGTG_09793 [Gaeumannomyces tritici R3-111a-1]EJT72942.1 hypothetical protein GGTG_09793 [Gaeumannomyces tritici R3-111a-1]